MAITTISAIRYSSYKKNLSSVSKDVGVPRVVTDESVYMVIFLEKAQELVCATKSIREQSI